MQFNNLVETVDEICQEKNLSKESVLEAIEKALATAYRKDFGNKNQNIQVKLNLVSGQMEVFDLKIVVEDLPEEVELIEDEKPSDKENKEEKEGIKKGEEKRRFNPRKEITISEAKKIKKKVKIGDEIKTDLSIPSDFGRVAAQSAKQVIIQKLREAERSVLLEEFKEKQGRILSGIIQRKERGTLFIDLGKITAIVPFQEQIDGENYQPGQRIKIYIIEVRETNRGPEVIGSRAHPEFLKEIFKSEIPEIANGIVEIKAIAREAGSRAKVAVSTQEKGVDPIGTCFPGNALVLTEDFGYKPIVQLVKGDRIITHLGNQEIISKTFKRIWNGTTCKFNVFGVYQNIETTKEHPILFIPNDRTKEKFITASEIKNGFLAIPTLEDVIFDKTIHYFEKEKDFLWVLGMYLAEGSLDVAEVNFTLSPKEKPEALKIQKIMAKYGGMVGIKNLFNRTAVSLYGKNWREVFKELGGEHCDKKQLNKRLMFLEPKLQLEIFNGWKDGDGHIRKQRNTTIVVTTSEKLLWQMYHILLRNRIRGSMRKWKERKNRKQAYSLEIAHNKTEDYRGFFRGKYYFSRIRKIEKGKRSFGRQFYNLEVKNNNSYIAYSIAVHNCIGQRGSRIQTIIAEIGGEKIDIIEYSDSPAQFITSALSPAKIASVKIADEENRVAKVNVKQDQLSLAIGRTGQNVRLAAKLTGWRIEVGKEEEVEDKNEKKNKPEIEEKLEEKESSKEKPETKNKKVAKKEKTTKKVK